MQTEQIQTSKCVDTPQRTRKVFRIILLVILLGSLLAVFRPLILKPFEVPETYHDPALYRDEAITDEARFGDALAFAGTNALDFLPSYEDVENSGAAVDFWLYDGRPTLSRTAITFTLDLTYATEAEYAAAKEQAMARYPLLTEDQVTVRKFDKPCLSFTIGDFDCAAVDAYAADAKNMTVYPGRVCLLCFNDKDRIIRWLDFYERESWEYVNGGDYIQGCTECPW